MNADELEGGAGLVRLTLEPKLTQVGSIAVRRALPRIRCRNIGPFVFLDHMGPTQFEPGHHADVLPHPHINLATVTYLFEGVLRHRDSTGADQVIRPGDVNWMFAGSGVVHSERTPHDVVRSGQTLHGLQLWLALPEDSEESAPRFEHHPLSALPTLQDEGVLARVLLGEAYGRCSPVGIASPTLCVDVTLDAGSSLPLPQADELGLYLIDGTLKLADLVVRGPQLVVFEPGQSGERAVATTRCHFVLLGGAPLGLRYMDWNFVSSSKERIEQAKRDWALQRFAPIPGDDQEFVPLPGAPRSA
jgi:redox-sensitive bicupin YhaK (pirin superfamily)